MNDIDDELGRETAVRRAEALSAARDQRWEHRLEAMGRHWEQRLEAMDQRWELQLAAMGRRLDAMQKERDDRQSLDRKLDEFELRVYGTLGILIAVFLISAAVLT